MKPLYKSYSFRDKDPIIHQVWDAVRHVPIKRLSEDSGLAWSTLDSWFYGATCRPQAASVRAVLRSQGLDLAIVQGLQELPDPVSMSRPERPRRVKHLKLISGGKDKDKDDKLDAWKKIRENRKKRMAARRGKPA